MTDPVTSNYSLTLPTVGSDAGTWGGIQNNNTFSPIDAALGSNLAITITNSNVSLTTTQFQNAIFVLTGTLTGSYSLIIPLSPNSATVACGGRFVVVNNTTGAYTITVLTAASASTGVTVPQGFTAFLYSDGTNVNYASSGLPGFALASNGNPNGLLAGTAGSANTNAQLAYDYVNSIPYVCTTTGIASGVGQAVWTSILGTQVQTPQGYLTPVSSTPIIVGDSVAATVIYYTPYTGTTTAVHNGTRVVPYTFSQMQLSLTASQAASNIYDVFIAYNAGTPVIGTGPSWVAGTSGSITAGSCARGTGVGGAALQRDSASGLWVNVASMSLIYNTGSGNNTITVAAGQGVYLGSIYMDTSGGKISCYRSWGQSRKFGIWNAYNRVPIILQVGDSTASWTYGTAPIRESNGSTANFMAVFTGLAEEQITCNFLQTVLDNAGSQPTHIQSIGIGWNSITAISGTWGNASPSNGGTGQITSISATLVEAPALGINNVVALETVAVTTTTYTFYGTQANMVLQGAYRG